MPSVKTPGCEQLATFLRKQQAIMGKTHIEIAERLTKFGYPISGETVARWQRTGAIPSLKNPIYAEIIAQGYDTELTVLWKVAGYTKLSPDELISIRKGIPESLLITLDRANEKQLKLIAEMVTVIMENVSE